MSARAISTCCLGIALLALVTAASWQFSGIRDHRSRADEARQRLVSLTEMIDSAPSIDDVRELENIASTYAVVESRNTDVGDLHATITDYLQRAGLHARSISTLAPVRHEGLTSWPVTLDCAGTFSGVLEFARRIDSVPLPLRVSRVQLMRADGAVPDELSIRIELAMIEIGGGDGPG